VNILLFLYLTLAHKAFGNNSLAAVEAETVATRKPYCCRFLTMRAECTHGKLLNNRGYHGFASGRGCKKTIL